MKNRYYLSKQRRIVNQTNFASITRMFLERQMRDELPALAGYHLEFACIPDERGLIFGVVAYPTDSPQRRLAGVSKLIPIALMRYKRAHKLLGLFADTLRLASKELEAFLAAQNQLKDGATG